MEVVCQLFVYNLPVVTSDGANLKLKNFLPAHPKCLLYVSLCSSELFRGFGQLIALVIMKVNQ